MKLCTRCQQALLLVTVERHALDIARGFGVDGEECGFPATALHEIQRDVLVCCTAGHAPPRHRLTRAVVVVQVHGDAAPQRDGLRGQPLEARKEQAQVLEEALDCLTVFITQHLVKGLVDRVGRVQQQGGIIVRRHGRSGFASVVGCALAALGLATGNVGWSAQTHGRFLQALWYRQIKDAVDWREALALLLRLLKAHAKPELQQLLLLLHKRKSVDGRRALATKHCRYQGVKRRG
mmetsp:Transcript_18717/g.47582  ORF Transcript_18717/g.47582 Transcript_18717/m.47582 type:complete len:236 (-) Transcript_18717:583-1290(-)